MSILDDNVAPGTIELFKDAESKINDKMLKYVKSVQDSLSLSDLNLSEKAMVAPSIHHGYVTCLFAEKRNLSSLEEKREKMEKDFINNYGSPTTPRYKTQQVATTDEKIIRLDKAIIAQIELIKYLEEACRILSNFGFSIKNAVELTKLAN